MSPRHTSPRSLQGARQRPTLDRHGVKRGHLRSSSHHSQLLTSPIGKICSAQVRWQHLIEIPGTSTTRATGENDSCLHSPPGPVL